VARFRPVDLDFVRTAPTRFVFETVVPADRVRMFDAVGVDAGGWKHWYPGFSDGHYEGEPGLGATRVIRYRGITFSETILAWDEPSRWTFRVDSATVPLAKALVEEWTFDEQPDGTLARWTFCAEPGLLLRALGPLQQRYQARLFERAMRNLAERLSD
jgi:hypothetical protein